MAKINNYEEFEDQLSPPSVNADRAFVLEMEKKYRKHMIENSECNIQKTLIMNYNLYFEYFRDF